MINQAQLRQQIEVLLQQAPNFLGDPDLSQLVAKVQELRDAEKPIEDTLRRAKVIFDLIEGTMQSQQHFRDLDLNQVASVIMSGVWSQMDVRKLTENFHIPRLILSGVPSEDTERYRLLIIELMPRMVSQLKQEGLLDSAQKSEFTQEPPRLSLAVPFTGSRQQLNSSTSFFARSANADILCSPLLLVGVGIAMLALAIVLQMVLSEEQSLSSSPGFSP